VQQVIAETKKISATWVGVVKIAGGMRYIAIPKRVAEYWDLTLGDEVLVSIKERKRLKVDVE